MIEVETDQKLEDYLKQICQKAARSGSDGLSSEENAYLRGLKDALRLVCLHRQQCAGDKPIENHRDDGVAAKLFQMSPEQVFKLNLDPDNEGCLKQFSLDELVEAAFRFENELMACLGDVNCIEWGVYADLTPGELVKVVNRSVSDICKYNKG